MARVSGMQHLLLLLVLLQLSQGQNALRAVQRVPVETVDVLDEPLTQDELRWGRNRYEKNFGVELAPFEREITLKEGLAWGHYSATCSVAQSIVNARVAAFLATDKGVAAGMVRLIFHDCFVQGCDASILLKLSSGSELTAIPNQTIRTIALQLVDDIKSKIEAVCPGIVSCSDIITMAAQQTIQQSGGPAFNVPLGRKDSFTFNVSATTDLPGPLTTFAQQSAAFTKKGLSTLDLVALVGAHTLGNAHCNTFISRLFPSVDAKLNPTYANYLKTNICPTNTSSNATGLDFFTPNTFDNQYFKNIPTGGALMPSDQNLDQNATAYYLVNYWGSNQQAFFTQFATSFINMVQIGVKTGVNGEIRKKCNTTNSGTVTEFSDSDNLSMVVDGRV